jgi:hypothetical protein
MAKIGYFFLTSNDHLYYISIYDSQYTIVDVYKHVAVEFASTKALKPREIEDFIAWMERQKKPVYLYDALKEKLYAVTLRVYTYEPRGKKRKIEVSEEA